VVEAEAAVDSGEAAMLAALAEAVSAVVWAERASAG